MFCFNCGREIKEGARFCPGCGTAVREKEETGRNLRSDEINDDWMESYGDLHNSKEEKAKKKNIIPLIAGAVIVLIAVMIAVFVISSSRSNVSKEYDSLISEAERYMETLDYIQAVATYKEAITVDAKQVEAYQGLIEVYFIMDEPELALDIADQGYEATGEEAVKAYYEEQYTLYVERIEEALLAAEEARIAAEEARIAAEEQDIRDMYAAYYQIITQREEKYGEGSCYVWYYNSYMPEYSNYKMSGVYYAQLLDFDADGTDELLIAIALDTDEYDMCNWAEVWAWIDGEAVKVYSPDINQDGYHSPSNSILNWYYNLYDYSDISTNLFYTYYEGKIYMMQGFAGAESYTYLYGYEDGSFKLVKKFESYWDSEDNEVYFIDDQSVDYEEYSTEHENWVEGQIGYTVQAQTKTESEELLAIKEATKAEILQNADN